MTAPTKPEQLREEILRLLQRAATLLDGHDGPLLIKAQLQDLIHSVENWR